MDLPEFQRRLANRVRALREARGLRQEDLENFGLAWKTVQKIEYANTDPKASTLLKLCDAFRVSLNDLLKADHSSRLRRGGPRSGGPGDLPASRREPARRWTPDNIGPTRKIDLPPSLVPRQVGECAMSGGGGARDIPPPNAPTGALGRGRTDTTASAPTFSDRGRR